MCEGNLSFAISESFDEILEKYQSFQILNEDKFPKNMKLKVLDVNWIFGACIDRSENQSNGLRKIKIPSIFSYSHIQHFIKDSEHITPEDKDYLNFEVLLRIESNLKQDLKDQQGK